MRRAVVAKRKAAGQRVGSTRAWRAVRETVLRRDGFRCQECGYSEPETVALGRTPVKSRLHADHIVPLAKGGDDDEANLRVLCARCNMSRGAKTTSRSAPRTYACAKCGKPGARLPGTRCGACRPL